MKFYIVKSGMQMFDLSRAYGLGAIINILSNSKSIVKDFGYYYVIENDGKINFGRTKKLSDLLSKDLPWWGPFTTQISIIPKKQKELSNFFKKQEITNLLRKYESLNEVWLKKEKKEILYGAMDPSAFKGERKIKKLEKYTEGDQLKVSKYDFILSLIGHLNFTVWAFKKEKTTSTIISILLSPDANGINIGGTGDIKSLKKDIQDIVFIHRDDILPTLAYVAVSIAKNVYKMKYEEELFVPKFSSLVFGVMRSGGPKSKPKPIGGGIYPLDFLYKMIESTEKSGKIFDQWINIFKLTNKPGYEDLAMALSEFITYPSEGTLEKYLKTHLRIFLNKKAKPELYEYDTIKEVIKNV
jgi:hypothetical protein